MPVIRIAHGAARGIIGCIVIGAGRRLPARPRAELSAVYFILRFAAAATAAAASRRCTLKIPSWHNDFILFILYYVTYEIYH